MIVLRNVTQRFEGRTVLEDISLRIDPGEFVCFTGPSGSGKSVLLSLLIGAEKVTSGAILIDDADLALVPPGALKLFRRRAGIIHQNGRLLKNMTVAENIAFPLEVCELDDRTIKNRVHELLDTFALTSCWNLLPRELSAGEKARTAIARGIAHKPLILLADEPLQNLDAEQSKTALQIFSQMQQNGATIVLATRDVKAIHQMQVRVIEISDGRISRETRSGFTDHAAGRGIEKTPNVSTQEKEAMVRRTLERVTKPQRKVKVTAIHSE